MTFEGSLPCAACTHFGELVIIVLEHFSRFSINAFIQLRETVVLNLNYIYEFFSVLTLDTLAACAACPLFGDTRFIHTDKTDPIVR